MVLAFQMQVKLIYFFFPGIDDFIFKKQCQVNHINILTLRVSDVGPINQKSDISTEVGGLILLSFLWIKRYVSDNRQFKYDFYN